MTDPNPYASPKVQGGRTARAADRANRGRLIVAWLCLLASCSGAMIYIYVDKIVYNTSLNAWPMLWSCFAFSIVTAIVTRTPILFGRLRRTFRSGVHHRFGASPFRANESGADRTRGRAHVNLFASRPHPHLFSSG